MASRHRSPLGVSLHRAPEPATFPNSNIVVRCLSLGMALIECLIKRNATQQPSSGRDQSAGAAALLNVLAACKACKHLCSRQSQDVAGPTIRLHNTPHLTLCLIFFRALVQTYCAPLGVAAVREPPLLLHLVEYKLWIKLRFPTGSCYFLCVN